MIDRRHVRRPRELRRKCARQQGSAERRVNHRVGNPILLARCQGNDEDNEPEHPEMPPGQQGLWRETLPPGHSNCHGENHRPAGGDASSSGNQVHGKCRHRAEECRSGNQAGRPRNVGRDVRPDAADDACACGRKNEQLSQHPAGSGRGCGIRNSTNLAASGTAWTGGAPAYCRPWRPLLGSPS